MTLQEIAKSLGKTLLIESTVVHIPKENIEVFEDGLMTEAVKGKSVPCRGVLRNVPVHVIGMENMNERVYPFEIEEKILEKRLAENTLSLADHPDKDDGSITRICGVWKNYRLNEEKNKGYADWYLVGDLGSLILDTVRAGGNIGVSRVGYGNISEDDKKTVIPEEYELVRLGDAVITPSAGVFANSSNIVDNPRRTEAKVENSKAIQEGSTLSEKNITNKTDKLLKEEVTKMDIKILEHTSRNQLNEAIRQANKSTNLVEAIQIVKGVSIPDEFPQLKERALVEIEKLEKKLEEQQAADKKALQEKDVELAKKIAESEAALKQAKELQEKLDVVSKIMEKSGLQTPDDTLVLKENCEAMKKDLEALTEDTQKRDEDIKSLVEERKLMHTDIKSLVEDTQKRDADIKCLVEDLDNAVSDVQALSKKLKEAEARITYYEKELAEGGFPFDEAEEIGTDEDEDRAREREERKKRLAAGRKDFKKGGETMTNESAPAEETIAEETVGKAKSGVPAKEYSKDIKRAKAKLVRKAKPVKEDDERPVLDIDDEDELEAGPELEMEPEEEVYEEIEESKPEVKQEGRYQFKKTAVKEAAKDGGKVSFVNRKSDIQKIYEEKVVEFPALKEIKEEILASKSSYDAVKAIVKFVENSSDDMRQMKKRESLTESYKFKS